MPFHCDDSRTNQWSFETLSELVGLSLSESGPGPCLGSLVEVLPAVAFKRNDGRSQIPGWATGANSKCLAFRHLKIDQLYQESKDKGFRLPRRDVIEDAGYSHAWLFQTPIIDAPKMLMVSRDIVFTLCIS